MKELGFWNANSSWAVCGCPANVHGSVAVWWQLHNSKKNLSGTEWGEGQSRWPVHATCSARTCSSNRWAIAVKICSVARSVFPSRHRGNNVYMRLIYARCYTHYTHVHICVHTQARMCINLQSVSLPLLAFFMACILNACVDLRVTSESTHLV